VAGVGGKRPGAGRPLGSRNRATADIRALAEPYGPGALMMLAEMAGLIPGKPAAESEQARITAGKELLDRAYGRSMQPVHGEQMVHIVGGIDAPPRPSNIEDAEQWLARRRRELAALDSPRPEQPQPAPRCEAPAPPAHYEPPAYYTTPQPTPGWTSEQEQDWQRREQREIGFRLPPLRR
jgi:hypothetical protein